MIVSTKELLEKGLGLIEQAKAIQKEIGTIALELATRQEGKTQAFLVGTQVIRLKQLNPGSRRLERRWSLQIESPEIPE